MRTKGNRLWGFWKGGFEEIHTEISVLNVTAGLLLGFNDVVTLLSHVLDEHFLESGC